MFHETPLNATRSPLSLDAICGTSFGRAIILGTVCTVVHADSSKFYYLESQNLISIIVIRQNI